MKWRQCTKCESNLNECSNDNVKPHSTNKMRKYNVKIKEWVKWYRVYTSFNSVKPHHRWYLFWILLCCTLAVVMFQSLFVTIMFLFICTVLYGNYFNWAGLPICIFVFWTEASLRSKWRETLNDLRPVAKEIMLRFDSSANNSNVQGWHVYQTSYIMWTLCACKPLLTYGGGGKERGQQGGPEFDSRHWI